MIRVATPSAIPSSEKIAMTDTNPSCRRARKYRNATILSNAPKITPPSRRKYPSPSRWRGPLPLPAEAGRGAIVLPRPACRERVGVRGSQLIEGRSNRNFLSLARAAILDLDCAGGKAARADYELI